MINISRYQIYLDGIRDDMYVALEEQEHTIESLRIKLGVNWATVRDRLVVMEKEGTVCKRLVGKTRLFYLNPERKGKHLTI